MTFETPKVNAPIKLDMNGQTTLAVTHRTKGIALDLQMEYRKLHGKEISQDRISATALKHITVTDLPTPEEILLESTGAHALEDGNA